MSLPNASSGNRVRISFAGQFCVWPAGRALPSAELGSRRPGCGDRHLGKPASSRARGRPDRRQPRLIPARVAADDSMTVALPIEDVALAATELIGYGADLVVLDPPALRLEIARQEALPEGHRLHAEVGVRGPRDRVGREVLLQPVPVQGVVERRHDH